MAFTSPTMLLSSRCKSRLETARVRSPPQGYIQRVRSTIGKEGSSTVAELHARLQRAMHPLNRIHRTARKLRSNGSSELGPLKIRGECRKKVHDRATTSSSSPAVPEDANALQTGIAARPHLFD
jgi:hypothetical protein